MTSSRTTRRIALLAGTLLLIACLFGDFLSSSRHDVQDLERYYAPPTRIHFFDADGRFHWRPFVYAYELDDPLQAVYRERTDTAFPLEFLASGHGYRLFGVIPASTHLVTAPGTRFLPWGADELGRDVLARALAGAQTSLLIVTLGVVACAILGLAVGALAALAGGLIDSALMRFSEFVLALPALYLVLALRAVLPARMPFGLTSLVLVGTIAAVAWPPLARAVRGRLLQLRNAGFVEAAVSLGCTRWQVFTRHMLPDLGPLVVSQSVLAAPVFLLGEVILSFLDIGYRESAESWGKMLRSLRDPRVMTDFWWNLAPLGLVFLTLLCLNVLAGRQDRRTATRSYLG